MWLIDAPEYKYQLAENMAPIIADLAKNYSHVLAPSSTFGKNIMPRVAALMDVQQISDIISIDSEDIFVRPIYAGNAIATVRSLDSVKLITVRTTAFKAAEMNGNAKRETVPGKANLNLSEFVKRELSASERPELTAAKIIVSGGRGMQQNALSVYQLGVGSGWWMEMEGGNSEMDSFFARLACVIPSFLLLVLIL